MQSAVPTGSGTRPSRDSCRRTGGGRDGPRVGLGHRLLVDLLQRPDRVARRHRATHGRASVGIDPGAVDVEDLDGFESCVRCELAQESFVGQRERPRCPRGWGRQERLERGQQGDHFQALGVSEGHDHDRAAPLGDTSNLAQRRNGVPGVLQRVEAGHHIEGFVSERQFLQIASAEVGCRDARSRDGQHRLRRVHAGYFGPTRSSHLCRHTRAAAGIEVSGSRPDARALQRRPCASEVLDFDSRFISILTASRITATGRASA